MMETRSCDGGFTEQKLQRVLGEKGRHVSSHRSSKVVKSTVSLGLVSGINRQPHGFSEIHSGVSHNGGPDPQ